MNHLIILGAIDQREINSRGYDISLIISIFIRNSGRTFPVSVSRGIYYALE